MGALIKAESYSDQNRPCKRNPLPHKGFALSDPPIP